MNCYLASRGRIQKTEESGLKQLEAAVTSLDQGGDRDGLLQQHDAAFCLPFRFSYHPHEGDQVGHHRLEGGGTPTREKQHHVACTLYLEHGCGTEAVISSVTSLTQNCVFYLFFRGCWSTADPPMLCDFGESMNALASYGSIKLLNYIKYECFSLIRVHSTIKLYKV